jgi:hypothetical protein
MDELALVRTSWWGRSFTLRGDDGTVGTLRWQSRLRSRVELEAPGGHWTAERERVLKRSLEILSTVTGEPVARFSFHGLRGGGTLTVRERTYDWRNQGALTRTRQLRSDEDVVVELQSRSSRKERMLVRAYEDLPERALTLLSCCFVALVQDEEVSAAAAGAAGAIAARS